ncbi:MAG: c-type cytochrome [Rhodothermales bacterium]|nr:c-type cytochrome [Rhodothermales bacterium]
MDDDESQDFLAAVAASSRPVSVRVRAASLLPLMNLEAAAPVAIALLNEVPPDTDPWPLFDSFLRQQNGLTVLADALRVQPIPAAFAQVGLDRVNQRGERFTDLKEAFVASGASPTVPRMDLDPNFYAAQRLEQDVKAQGNPAHGEAIYRRASLVCNSCHAIGGAGGAVGPDLSSIGVTAPADYLIESLLKPEKAVKDGYALVRIVMRNGSLMTGMLVQDAGDALIVRDAAGAVTRVPTNQIEQRAVLPGSLMPAGLMGQLERDEFVDLVAFLSALGEEGAYRVSRTPFVRRWRVLSATEATIARLQDGEPGFAATEANLPWMPAYSTVAGTLPLDELAELVDGDVRHSFVHFDLDVQQAGSVVLAVNDAEGLLAWVGPQSAPLSGSQVTVDLSAGMHRVTLSIDRAARAETTLQVELLESASSARAAFVVGR